jgi:hypothetical protein
MPTLLITNPRRVLHNGVLNRLVAQHLGSFKSGSATKMGRRSVANREAIRAFKRDKAKYARFKKAHKLEIREAQQARKARTKASKEDVSKHFLVAKAGYSVKQGRLVRPKKSSGGSQIELFANSPKTRKNMRKNRRGMRHNAVAEILKMNKRRRRAKKASAKARKAARRMKMNRRRNPVAVRIVQNKRRKMRANKRHNPAFLVPNKRPKHSKKHAKKHAKRGRKMARRFKLNTGMKGLKAILAPAKSLLKSEFALASLGGAAAVGVAHYFVAPMVAEGLKKAGDMAASIPVVGGYVQQGLDLAAEYAPYTATGTAAGAALAALGVALKRPKLGYTLGALAASSGIVMDVMGGLTKRASGGMGALYESFPPPAAYGAITAEAVDYGAIAERLYGDAQMADASVCGKDFSPEEGQALIQGPAAVMAVAGTPSVAQGVRRTDASMSRFAGQKMHRWGWLIKAVGFERARKIAMLAPADRLKVIAQLRAQAMAAVDASGYGAVAQIEHYGAVAEAGGFGAVAATGASAYGAAEIVIGGGY